MKKVYVVGNDSWDMVLSEVSIFSNTDMCDKYHMELVDAQIKGGYEEFKILQEQDVKFDKRVFVNGFVDYYKDYFVLKDMTYTEWYKAIKQCLISNFWKYKANDIRTSMMFDVKYVYEDIFEYDIYRHEEEELDVYKSDLTDYVYDKIKEMK